MAKRTDRGARTLRGLLVAIVVWVTTSTFASGDDWYERFQLWTHCQPVSLGVSVQAPVDLGLEEYQVTSAARSRLRAARIYLDPSDAPSVPPRLGVWVHGIPEVHNGAVVAACVDIELQKILEDHSSEAHYFATTWSHSFVLSYAKPRSILSVVSRLMDEFIDKYLAVNAAACNN